MILALLFFLAQQVPAPESCVVCHGKEGKDLAQSIHAKAGILCTSCHGGDGTALEVEAAHGKDLKRYKTPREALDSCGSCHSDVQKMRVYGLRTDQLSLYWTSKHGEKLAADGDPNVATCTSCHGTHDVLRVSDTRSPVHPFNQVATCGRCHADAKLMGEYKLDPKVVEQYRASIHGKALMDEAHPAAPACATCHGSHGANPPRTRDIEQVCGQCHSVVQAHYDESPHAKAAALGKSAVQCASCHGSHTIGLPSPAMFLGDEEHHCGSCHMDEKDKARGVAQSLHDGIEDLGKLIDEAEKDLRTAAGRGLFLGPEKGYLDDARGLLVRARASTHKLSPPAQTDLLDRADAMVLQTREGLATKARIFRDHKLFTDLFCGLTAIFALVLLMYGRIIAGGWKRTLPGDREVGRER
jgi:cytochrome c553